MRGYQEDQGHLAWLVRISPLPGLATVSHSNQTQTQIKRKTGACRWPPVKQSVNLSEHMKRVQQAVECLTIHFKSPRPRPERDTGDRCAWCGHHEPQHQGGGCIILVIPFSLP